MSRKEQLLTLTIAIHKRSSVRKVKRFAFNYQHFKNSFYILMREYYRRYGDLTPFTQKRVLKKLFYGQLKLANFTSEDYYVFVQRGFEIFGADTIKAILNQLHKEIKSCIALANVTGKLHLPKPRKLAKCSKIAITLNPNMYDDQRLNKRKCKNRLLIRPMKGISFTVSIPNSIQLAGSPILVYHREGYVTVHISYSIHITHNTTQTSHDSIRWLSIDFGVNNVVSLVSNVLELKSILINGNSYKAF